MELIVGMRASRVDGSREGGGQVVLTVVGRVEGDADDVFKLCLGGI